MVWWQWVVLGAVLLGAEMMVVDAAFYLVFLGAAALLVGGVGFLGLPLSWSAQWVLFAVLSVVSLLLFRERLYARVRGTAPLVGDGVVGEFAIAREAIAPGDQGTVQLRGSEWTARNVGDRPIPASARSIVESVSGATVAVRAAD